MKHIKVIAIPKDITYSKDLAIGLCVLFVSQKVKIKCANSANHYIIFHE